MMVKPQASYRNVAKSAKSTFKTALAFLMPIFEKQLPWMIDLWRKADVSGQLRELVMESMWQQHAGQGCCVRATQPRTCSFSNWNEGFLKQNGIFGVCSSPHVFHFFVHFKRINTNSCHTHVCYMHENWLGLLDICFKEASCLYTWRDLCPRFNLVTTRLFHQL